MALDPVIAGGFRGLQLQDPLEQYARVSQIQQAQQQNQLAALKMQEYQREVETENRLRALYQRPGADIRSPEFLREVYSVSPAKGAAMQRSAFEAEKEKRLSDAAMEDLTARRIANARQMLPSVTPATWGAWRAETVKKLPGLENMIPEAYSDDAKAWLMQNADQYLASVKPMVVAPGASVFKPGSTTPMFTAPVAPAKPTPAETEEIVLRLQDPNLPPASRKALQDRLRILTTREPKEPKEPNKPVEVVGPDGRPIIVSAEEAISKRMTPAKAMEGLAPKEIQKREAEYPKATASFKNFVAKSEQYIKELEKLRDDPGLDSITGTIYGVTPGVISGPEGRRAKAQYDKVFAKGGFQALQDLKAMSPAGGALGNVSNEEGRRLEASTVGGLDRSQDLADVKQGINDYIAEIRGSMKRVGDAYGDTYEYRTSRGGAPVAPAGLSPEDKQALDWANQNPKSPYAAEIKKRLKR